MIQVCARAIAQIDLGLGSKYAFNCHMLEPELELTVSYLNTIISERETMCKGTKMIV